VKSLSITLLTIALLLSCSEAPKIEAEPTPRVVLAELFTFARCTYCPFSEHALDSLTKEYEDSLAVIAYHRRVLGDTLSPEYVAVRESLYQIDVSPTVVFDGIHVVQTEDPNQNYSTYQNYIIQRRTITPKLRLYLETTLISFSVNLKLHIVAIDSIENGDYHLFFVVYEDSVYFAQSGAPESTFSYVMRKMIPDAYGTPITVVYSDSFVEEVDFNLQPNWDIEKLGVVVFIQDMETKEVMQAIIQKFEEK
jgi:glutaredoxin